MRSPALKLGAEVCAAEVRSLGRSRVIPFRWSRQRSQVPVVVRYGVPEVLVARSLGVTTPAATRAAWTKPVPRVKELM